MGDADPKPPRVGHPLRVGAHVRHTNAMRREATFGVVEEGEG